MVKEIVRVENPMFMTHEEIRDKYWGKEMSIVSQNQL